MKTHYYLSVFPLEALIASQLDPVQFGRYMSIGKKNGSFERIIFIEIQGEVGDAFDWDYARKRCVPHDDGAPKNSVWMSVYRALERVEFDQFRSLHLITADGRNLEIEPVKLESPPEERSYYVYQELCPIAPMVVSSLDPLQFSAFMTDKSQAVGVPTIVFADIRALELDSLKDARDTGPVYDKNLGHLRECILQIRQNPDKRNKNLERSFQSFAYNIIDRGIYVGDAENVLVYPIPSRDELRRNNYDWGRSAMIL
ncbi:MAG: hypothetical protein EA427_05090 [Spirochaetaceae bacterium]|nr:MAG: hypothetical protein EA427_05090 [Spirochaetaceae bacterium]